MAQGFTSVLLIDSENPPTTVFTHYNLVSCQDCEAPYKKCYTHELI